MTATSLTPGGRFVISLDFELHWGVRARRSVSAYRANLLGVRDAVPAMLALFREYDVHVTWATVGMLFYENKRSLMEELPERLPCFADRRLSSYSELDEIGDDEHEDPYHYAPSLVLRILSEQAHEIGSHTFSHYFCLEAGADVASFRDDLEAARRASSRFGVLPRTLVFPGNQIAPAYAEAAAANGMRVYRGTESAWLYRPTARGEQTMLRRGLRLLDAYVTVTSHNTYDARDVIDGDRVNVPASRFLRPYIPSLAALESLRAWRIRTDLEHAAKRDLVYHLWWHPHNFGVYLNENLAMLRRVLRTFAQLRERYGMRSVTMGELADEIGDVKT
ncbi:MAG TPA: polysaccharide deacetylase family protein [Candidatus Limnocylindria bacterium]|nr:polysaccharide deacetylase family protein [Candidatus Limnocylindria bacterium]